MTNTPGCSGFMGYLETRGDVGGDLDRLHGLIRPPPHTRDTDRSGRDLRCATHQLEGVTHRLPREGRHADPHVELVLEPEHGVKIARCGDAGPADLGLGGMDAEAGLAPERVL